VKQPAPRPLNPGDEAKPGTPGTGEACRSCGGTGKVIRGIGGA
jgi:hypothetical protein